MNQKDEGAVARNAKLYSTVTASGKTLSSAPTQSNSNLRSLKKELRDLLVVHPSGVSLSKARRSCPLLHDADVLKGFASVRELLGSIPDVVTLRGLGVQTLLFPSNASTNRTHPRI